MTVQLINLVDGEQFTFLLFHLTQCFIRMLSESVQTETGVALLFTFFSFSLAYDLKDSLTTYDLSIFCFLRSFLSTTPLQSTPFRLSLNVFHLHILIGHWYHAFAASNLEVDGAVSDTQLHLSERHLLESACRKLRASSLLSILSKLRLMKQAEL